MIRQLDGTYESVRVFDPTLSDPPMLVSTRTLEFAPWSDREFYTGGYDGAANNRRNHNTAWIFKATLNEKRGKKKRPAVKWVKPSEDMTGKKAGQAVDPQITWKRSLQLPLTDSAGKTLIGTEILELVPHGGRLYANNSHWGSDAPRDPGSKGGFVYGGASQVFVKDSADGPWRVDVQLGPEVTRASCLKSVTFATDATGKAIPPREVLVLGVNRARVKDGGQTPIVIYVRDDATGKWIERTLGMSDTTRWAVTISSMGFHRDKVTGADILFVGVGPGAGIYTGVFDASMPGCIRFSEKPEFRTAQTQRVLDFCDVGGTFYAASQKVLYKRVQDGPQAKWTTVWDPMKDTARLDTYGADLDPGWVKYDHFRAFAADHDPATGKDTLLFSALNRIFCLDPATDRFEPEVDIRELFRKQLAMDVYYIQAQHNDRIRRPDGRESLVIGLELMFDDKFVPQHPEVPVSSVPDQPWSSQGAAKTVHWAKQGFYLERWRENGTVKYAIREIHNTTRTTPDWLARVRSVCESPFMSERGRVLYAAGFGAWGLWVSNTGWVYRGEYQNQPMRRKVEP
jgi:hypothetical protein